MTVTLPQKHYIQAGQSTKSPRELLQTIRGTSCSLPDYAMLLQDYSSGSHADLDMLRTDTSKYLTTLSSSPMMSKIIIKADLAGMAARIAPYASYERTRTIAFLIAWGYVWDDQLDIGPFRECVTSGEGYRRRTQQFVKHSLGLAKAGDVIPQLSPETDDDDRIIIGFDVIGREIRTAYSIAQRRRLFAELVFWIESTRQEQIYYKEKIIPTAEQYWTLRMALSGYGVTLAMIEYAWNMELPASVMNEPAIRQLIASSIANMWIANDVCSLRKELADDQFSMPSCLMLDRDISMQTALDQCITWVKAALFHFDEQVVFLRTRYHSQPAILALVNQFIKGCENQITGNGQWSCLSARYGVPKAEDGLIWFTF